MTRDPARGHIAWNNNFLWTWNTLGIPSPDDNHVVHIKKGAFEGQRNAHIDAVRTLFLYSFPGADTYSGLDNAGKTTIVKKIMGEDVNTVSPTLGFIIKTIDYEGWVEAMKSSPVFCWPCLQGINLISVSISVHLWIVVILTFVVKGMLVARKLWDRTGEITLKRPTHSYGLSMRLIACVLKTAGPNCTAYYKRKFVLYPSHPCWHQHWHHPFCQRLSGASLLVFANKTDVNGCMDETEIQEVCAWYSIFYVTSHPLIGDHGQGLRLEEIRSHKWHIIRCSAVTGTNLNEGLAWVVNDAKARLFLFWAI